MSSAGRSPAPAWVSARDSSQSASHGLRGSSGPCRYVPTRVAETASFEARHPVVPEAVHDAPERRGIGVEHRTASVVLEAGEQVTLTGVELALEEHVADHARLARDGLVREEAGAWHERAVSSAIATTEELVPAAHCEHRDATRMRCSKRLALASEIRRDERLLAILASTDVQQVVRGRVELVADPDRPNDQLVATQLRTTREDRDVAAIGVDVQVVGVQVTEANPHQALASQYGRTAPRSVSTPRSSSIAV